VSVVLSLDVATVPSPGAKKTNEQTYFAVLQSLIVPSHGLRKQNSYINVMSLKNMRNTERAHCFEAAVVGNDELN
jgi:hypothetical protein